MIYRKSAAVMSPVLIYPSTNPIGMAIVLLLSHTYDANTDKLVSMHASKKKKKNFKEPYHW